MTIKKNGNAEISKLMEKKSFRKVVESFELLATTDPMSDLYPFYNGYAPLTIRVVQKAARGGWNNECKILKVPTFPKKTEDKKKERIRRLSFDLLYMTTKNPEMSATPGATYSDDNTAPKKKEENEKKPVLVVFLGGCTFAEISALRALEKSNGQPYIVITTNFTTGDVVVSELMDFY